MNEWVNKLVNSMFAFCLERSVHDKTSRSDGRSAAHSRFAELAHKRTE